MNTKQIEQVERFKEKVEILFNELKRDSGLCLEQVFEYHLYDAINKFSLTVRLELPEIKEVKND